MAGPKAKSASSNTGAIKKSKSTASSTNGTSSPVPPPSGSTPDVAAEHVHNYGHGRPDKSIYDAEQDKIKGEIDALQVKLVSFALRVCILYSSHRLLTLPYSRRVFSVIFFFSECSEGQNWVDWERWGW